jgi:hypothetical protein
VSDQPSTSRPAGGADREVGGMVAIFLRLAPVDIALVKFVFESYEEVGLIRTIDREVAIIVALISRDFLAAGRGILADLQSRVPIEEIAPPETGDDWLLPLLEDEAGPKPSA